MIYNNIGNVVNSIYNSKGLQSNILYDSSGNLLTLSENKTLKVMTYNIGIFTGRNTLDVLLHIVNTYDADLIGLQEVLKTSLNSNFNKAFGNYPHYKLGALYNKDGILSKTELINTSSTLYNYNTLEQRAFTKGYISFNGHNICFINTHLELTSGGEAKVRQALLLHEILKNEEYFILTGDFNTICKDTSHREYELIIKPFLDMGCHSVNCSPEFGFTNTWTNLYTLTEDNGYPTDHIIVSKNIKIVNHVYDTYKLGLNIDWDIDHIPVIAEVKILSAEEQTIFMLNDKSYTVEKGTTWRLFAENPFYEITIDDTKVFKSLIPVVDSDNNYVTPDQEIKNIAYTTYNA